MDLEALLQAIREGTADWKEAATALQKHAQPLFQEVFNRGHSEATDRADAKLQAEREAKEAAQKEAKRLKDENEELREGQPEAEKIRKDYEEQLRVQREEYEAKLEDAEQKAENADRRVFVADIRRKAEAMGVSPDWLEVQLERSEWRDRIKPVDGEMKIMQEAGKEVPIPGEADDAVEVFAKELREAAPPEWITRDVDSGAGTGSGPTRRPGSSYDPVKAGQEAAKQAKGEDTESLAYK